MIISKQSRSKKYISWLVIIAMIVTMVPLSFALHTDEAYAATSVKSPRVSSDKTTWDCVWFGNYPQTEIVDKASRSGCYDRYWEADGDYVVDSSLYTKLKNATYDSNGDTTINGKKYRRLKASDATHSDSSYSVYYNWPDDSTYHYFRYDPIKWRVLESDGNDAFLLADIGLDDKMYNEVHDDVTWETCTLRSWLNGYGASSNKDGIDYSVSNFIDMSFTSDEQSAIIEKTIKNEDNKVYSTEGGNDTTDKIFLLSESEVYGDDAVKYGFASDHIDDEARQSKSSTYAKAMGVWSITGSSHLGNCYWWLRSPGCNSHDAACVDRRGFVDSCGQGVNCYCIAVRPALHLNLKSTNLWSYAGKVDSDGNTQEVGTDKTVHSTSGKIITESDLFNSKYSKYLLPASNKAYQEMLQIIWEDIQDITYANEDKTKRAVVATALKNGATKNVREIISSLTGNSYTYGTLEEEAAQDLLNAISNNSTLMTQITGDAEKEFKEMKKAYKLIRNGQLSVSNLNLFAEYLSGKKGYSKEEIIKLYNAVDSNWSTINGIFKKAGIAIGVADTTACLIEARMSSAVVINKLTQGEGKGTSLHDGLVRINNKQKNTTAQALVTELIKNDGFEYIADALLDVGSGAFGFVDFGFKLIGDVIAMANHGDANDLAKNFLAESNYLQIGMKADDEAMKIFKDSTVDAEDDFKFFKEAEFVALDKCVDYALKTGNSAQKKKLTNDYNKYKKYFTCEKYIESCLANANTDWQYTVKNGKAQIVSKSARKEKSTSLKSSLLIEANADEVESVVIDVPDSIDGYVVDEISSEAFRNDFGLECVYISESVKKISSNAFSGCSNLKGLFMEEGVEEIGDNAFSSCTSLTDIKFPASVKEIGSEIFSESANATIYGIEGSVAQDYAKNNAGVTFEQIEPEVVNLHIATKPSKLKYGMSENDIDLSGIKVTAEFSDGSREDVTKDVCAYFPDKKLGTCSVGICYLEAETSYEVTVIADECDYTVRYEDLAGNQIKDDYIGKAIAGEIISIPIPNIEGYTPVKSNVKVTIGSDNMFVVQYKVNELPSIEDADIAIVPSIKEGTGIKPNVIIKYKGDVLIEDTDYTLTYEYDIENNKITVIAIGIGEYQGVVSDEYYATVRKIKASSVSLNKAEYAYSGKSITPAVTVKIAGTKLKAGRDYTIKCSSNKSVGKATVKIIGRGTCSGTVTKTFKINPKGTTIKIPASAKKAFTAKWTKQPAKMSKSRITGYQIQYSTSSKFKNSKTVSVKGYSKTSKKISKLKAKKKYYVRVRTYKTVSGTKYYSSWSKTKSVKTK